MCPEQSQAFKEVNNSQAFTVGLCFYSFFFWTSRFHVHQGVFAQSFAHVFEKLTAYNRTTIQSHLTPKIESPLKPSNYVAKPWFLHVYRAKIQMSTPFFMYTLKFCACLMCPCRVLCECFFFFSLEMWDPSRPKHPKKYNNPNIWRKKTNKQIKATCSRFGRGTLNTAVVWWVRNLIQCLVKSELIWVAPRAKR